MVASASFGCFPFWKASVRAGTIVSDPMSDAIRVMVMTNGNEKRNRPMIPVMNIIEAKKQAITKVVEVSTHL